MLFDTHRLWLCILLILCLNVKAQTDTIHWVNRTAFPDIPKIDYASFVIDSDYYVIGGDDGSGDWLSSVWRYNISTDSWHRMHDFPGGPITTAAGFAINGHGYVCSGSDSISGYNNDNEFWEYYPVVDTWQHKANYPGVPVEAPVSFVYNQYAYVGLGYGVGAYPIWRYNAISDVWDSVSTIPSGPRSECGVAVVDSFTYILAGFYNNTGFKDIWRYNLNRDHWDSIGLMPGNVRANVLFWTFGKTILIGYGEQDDSSGNPLMGTDLYSFDTRTHKWDTLTCVNFPDSIADGQGAGCFKFGRNAYFFGGYRTYVSPSYYSNVWSFDATKFFGADTNVGIQELAADAEFRVYPNPAQVEREFTISASEGGLVTFCDELGRVIDERKLTPGINSIKISDVPGIIFYRATLQNGSVKNGKIVMTQ
jgi:N-acetylneuraminic acid mutarotase